ncbi:MAG: NAD(P)/FAD-dependent oxidoreductase [Alphaproteobacteria bacterium]
MSGKGKYKGEHALVIGGSLGGLCTAQVLSKYFQRVTVVDKDAFPAGADHRPGVPQSQHPHAMLHGGRLALEKLFPGFEKNLLDRGGLALEPGRHMAVLQPWGWVQAAEDTPFNILFSSRILIESVVRDIARKTPNLAFLEQTEVLELIGDSAPATRVLGARIRGADGVENDLRADLTIDASGRMSASDDWLSALGLEVPTRTVIDAKAGYSTRWYQAPPRAERPADWWWYGAWLEPGLEAAQAPEKARMAVVFPIEGDRWIVSIASWGGDDLPANGEDFEAATKHLRSPLVRDAISVAEPISKVYRRRGMQNIWRHYERWPVKLAGFVATGDAACAFNPIYGQGMTSAAYCAQVIDKQLKKLDPAGADFPQKAQKALAQHFRVPWLLATSRDMDKSGEQFVKATEAETGMVATALRKLGQAYARWAFVAAPRDAVVRNTFLEVMNLVRNPLSLFLDPRVVVRVVLANIKARREWKNKPKPSGEITPYPPVPAPIPVKV